MNLKQTTTLLLVMFIIHSCKTQPTENTLKDEIEQIIATKKGDIGLAIIDSKSKTILEINGNKSYPMLSTFKFPIALAILNKVEKGELALQQKIYIDKKALFENTWSPFREKSPQGNRSISLLEALDWMIVYSDNNMTDILLQQIGGVETVNQFLKNKNFVIQNNEEGMHENWEAQFVNTATPKAFSELLQTFSEGKLLNNKNTEWLHQAMIRSTTGTKRLKGKLPNVIIAQRAGTSFTSEQGIIGAINNVGIITLPNNEKIYIAVFIHNTPEEFKIAEEIIADIAKVTYDNFTKK